jgi:hypothetical protein
MKKAIMVALSWTRWNQVKGELRVMWEIVNDVRKSSSVKV